jgi:excisionase family DNA binding protein
MSKRKDHAEEVAKSQPRDEISPRLFNIAEAAKYMSCSVWFVRTMIWGGRIPYLKLGKGYQLDRSDLDKFIDSEKQKGW